MLSLQGCVVGNETSTFLFGENKEAATQRVDTLLLQSEGLELEMQPVFIPPKPTREGFPANISLRLDPTLSLSPSLCYYLAHYKG